MLRRFNVRLSIFGKLISGFLLVLLLLSIVATIAIVQVSKADQSYSGLLDRRSLVIENVQQLIYEGIAQENSVRGLILTGDTNNEDEYYSSRESFDAALAEFAGTAPNKEAEEQITELTNNYNDYEQMLHYALTNYDKDEKGVIHFLQSEELELARNAFYKEAQDILSVANNVMATDQKDARNTISFVTSMLIIATITSIVLGIVISLLISRSISGSIIKVSNTMEELADGNFAIEEVNVKNKDEIGDLVKSMNIMIDRLKNTLSDVSQSSEEIDAFTEEVASSSEQSTTAANQLATISEQNALGAEDQLQSFEETASKVNTINDRIANIVSLSEGIMDNTHSTQQVTAKGTEYVNNIVNHMDDIHNSSSRTTEIIRSLEKHSNEISAITAFITSLSEQTNLLALNAAIEAARAGEHGQGFTVVAEEVRQLAEESQESAGKVISMVQIVQTEIQQAVTSMENETELIAEGIEQTNETKQAFSEIEQSVQMFTGQISKTAQSVNEIEQYINEIAKEIEEVRQISESNLHHAQEESASSEEQLAISEEITSAIQRLVQTTEQMQAQVSRFRF